MVLRHPAWLHRTMFETLVHLSTFAASFAFIREDPLAE